MSRSPRDVPAWHRERGRGSLDRSLVERVSIGSKELKIYLPGSGECSDPWVWTYLVACLATSVGLEEARAIVDIVKCLGEA